MRQKIALLMLCLCIPFCATAQIQRGYVKTIGRPGKPGVLIGGVTIRWKGPFNSAVTNSKGQFKITMPGKKDGDAIVLQSVHKKGFQLKDDGIIGQPQVFSTSVPIEIVMISNAQLEADKQRITKNANKKAEKNYQKKLNELKKQVRNREITTEKYQKELLDLQKKYESYLSLVGDLADRYARTDYDKLDSIDYQINVCIENGELEKADSLILTVFDPETVLDRNRAAKEEIQQRIEFAQKIIDKANADKEAIMRDFEYAERVVTLSNILATQYLSLGEKEKAINCMRESLEIITIIHGKDSGQVKQAEQKIKLIQQ